ncbi:DHH family phosphoesterase [Haloarcula argentinensis]|uniref:OB-fold nucleic acid binding domain-containing protein n=1 Tax=Haloarcula argentinensis TaxID=43776 RepID=A0A830FQ98_HALAR|nr:OB-fold nucleic acid binding domain-containing protein [Haloarcula argentinensis]EMA18565.1 RecJ-like exonuclease [Haloarcula argentinensis DSM 12282]MDS0253877.1 OB-fold nucleic acid binding domain-containing protein [Haloarcula argentinensis]GGM46023.1 phosphoesterase [Haloarcula argentinensis]
MSSPTGTGDGATVPDGGTIVYDLADQCTSDDLEEGALYHATVNGTVEYGVFVDLSDAVSGLVHDSNLLGQYDVGDDLIVELGEIRPDGDLSFEEVQVADYDEQHVVHGNATTVTDLAAATGETVIIEGQVVQIKQTGGPTVFQVRDETGIVPCAAFEEAGVRAHPDVEIDDIVRVSGRAEERDDGLQVEAESLTVLDGEAADDVQSDLDAALAEAAEPADVEPLVEWPAFEKLWDDLREVATELRKTVLSGRPIRMRHHADGDGLCASVPLQVALESFIASQYEDASAPQHLLKRLPSKAPYYEMEDVTRDLNFALEDRTRHGQKLPMLLMLDNGSTEEDTPAYRNLRHYDIPVVVVDHHHPDPEAVEPLIEQHVNPYLHDEDYRITTGMLCVELARMIDPDITADLQHVPAVAGLSDRSEAEAMRDYIDLASEKGYDENDLRDIGEALDYATHWLRYNSGEQLITDVLNVDCDDRDRHGEVVDFLAERAERDVEDQLDAAMSHVEHERLDNGAHLYTIDVENHAHRFTYPAPGKTTGEIHDRKVAETGDPVITIGYGPDFAVLRSDGVRLDIPRMVTELTEEVDGGGVSGGGHLVVGSIKFVKGRRESVIDALVEKMAEAEIDEELGSSTALPEEV